MQKQWSEPVKKDARHASNVDAIYSDYIDCNTDPGTSDRVDLLVSRYLHYDTCRKVKNRACVIDGRTNGLSTNVHSCMVINLN